MYGLEHPLAVEKPLVFRGFLLWALENLNFWPLACRECIHRGIGASESPGDLVSYSRHLTLGTQGVREVSAGGRREIL